MTSFVALLRGINVGGQTMVAMTELRRMAESLGMVEVQSLLQSGNLVFKSKTSNVTAMEKLMEKEAMRLWSRPIDFFVRTAKEWETVLAQNPFPGEAARDPGHLLVVCLKAEPDAKALAALKAAITGPEYFQAAGRHLYLVYPDGVGRSRLTNTLLEKTLGTRATGRNWNTVRKISALLAAA